MISIYIYLYYVHEMLLYSTDKISIHQAVAAGSVAFLAPWIPRLKTVPCLSPMTDMTGSGKDTIYKVLMTRRWCKWHCLPTLLVIAGYVTTSIWNYLGLLFLLLYMITIFWQNYYMTIWD